MKAIFQYIFKAVMQGFVLSIVIAMVLIFIEILYGRDVSFDHDFSTELLHYCLYGVTLTLINSTYFDYLNHRLLWQRYGRFRILIGAFGSVILTMIGVFFVRMIIHVVLGGETLAGFIGTESPRHYVVPLLITIFMSLFFHTVYFYKKNQEHKVKEQKIIAGTASAQFESLKNQIDPHFLFNSLNVLSSLIEENPDNAQRFTTSLSKVYRYVLEQKDKELISVEEELAFARTYMNLLKMRFENSVSYELPEALQNPDAKVVPLSLQLLLENTVKHNVASESRPLHIRIFERGDYLVVENDYQKKEVIQDGRGVGLQNIINRYSIITNRQVNITQTEKIFSVALPMLTKQISIMESNYNSENDLYYKAQKRVEEIKGFYGNLTAYVVVITGLTILNYVTSPNNLWFFYPAIGWGIGVAIHGLSVFNYMPFMGSDWEERKIRQLMDKDKTDKWA